MIAAKSCDYRIWAVVIRIRGYYEVVIVVDFAVSVGPLSVDLRGISVSNEDIAIWLVEFSL